MEIKTENITTSTPNDLMNRNFESYPIRRDNSLLKTFDSLILNGRLSDVTFVVEGRQIAAHRFILAARSSIFESMFYGSLTSNVTTVTVTDCNYDVFLNMLIYIYTDAVDIHKNNVVPVMMIAHKYDLSFLEAQCEDFILKCEDMEEVLKYFDVLFLVDAFCTLKKNLITHIKDNTENHLYSRHLFTHISNLKTLEYLLDEIVSVDSEDNSRFYLNLFEMLIEWAKEQCEKNDTEINAVNIRQSLGGLEQRIDTLKFNREDFLTCLEICPNFYSSIEMIKIDENLAPSRVEQKRCRFCAAPIISNYRKCCGFFQ